MANSLAIAMDATHLACDLAGFLVSLFAIWIARKPATSHMSFGYYRAGLSLFPPSPPLPPSHMSFGFYRAGLSLVIVSSISLG